MRPIYIASLVCLMGNITRKRYFALSGGISRLKKNLFRCCGNLSIASSFVLKSCIPLFYRLHFGIQKSLLKLYIPHKRCSKEKRFHEAKRSLVRHVRALPYSTLSID